MKIDNSGKVNWVQLQGDCTQEGILSLVLNQAKEDIDHMNSLPQTNERNIKFSVEMADKGIIVRKETTKETSPYAEERSILASVRFSPHSTNGISVYSSATKGLVFKFTFKWDDIKTICELRINDDTYKLWQISQMALSPLFFGRENE